MPHPIPELWFQAPPRTLLAGDGPYASGLAPGLGAAILRLAQLEGGPSPKPDGAYDHPLDNLESALMLVPEGMSPAETICHHQWLWDWIEKLTSAKDCHPVSFVFILDSAAPTDFDRALATGLAMHTMDPRTYGHAVWRRSGTTDSLTTLLRATLPRDLQTLRGRCAADARSKAIATFAALLKANADHIAISRAANQIASAFKDHEYDLDMFCLPPCHRNGNVFRQWLQSAVTGSVTPDSWEDCKRLASSVIK